MATQDRYHILSSVVQIANCGAPSPLARLKSLADFVVTVFPLESLTIYLLDEERRYLTLQISSVVSDSPRQCHIPLGQGTAGSCADAKRVMELELATCDLHPDELVKGNEQRLFLLPVMDKEWLAGVISCGLAAGVSLTPPQKSLLQDIVTEILGLIRHSLTARASGRRIRHLGTLGELGTLLNKSLPPENLIPLILKHALDAADAVCVVLRLAKTNGLPAGVYKKCGATARDFLPSMLSLEQTSSGEVLASGSSRLLTDLIAEPGFPLSSITISLEFEATLLGTLTVFGRLYKSGYCNYDEEDRELLQTMGVLIANALESAANHRQMLALTEELEKKFKELSLLYRISNTMLSTINANKLIHLILTALTGGKHPCFDRAMLFLLNERTGILQGMLGVTRETAEVVHDALEEADALFVSRWDISNVEMDQQRDSAFSKEVRATRLVLDKKQNVCSRAILENRCTYIPDVEKGKNVDRDFVIRFDITSFAVAPLIARGKAIGVILVDNAMTHRGIRQDDLRYLQLFTNQAGMAIENSMLYNRIEDTDRHLQEAREKIVQGEKLAAIGEMAAKLAHELKNPLVSMGGFAKRLTKKLAAGSSEWKYADIIAREVERLESMLSDILVFSKKSTICYVECDINTVIEDSLAIVEGTLNQRRVMIKKSLAPHSIRLKGDCQQLKQVFINLFTNASDAMEHGGELEIAVDSATIDGKKAVAVTVSDTGGGVPLELLNKIFDPFFTSKESGTGLGLAIAQAITANHGGRIQLNNQIGVGATFTVTLPLQM